ncbi:hypothetical protein U8335_16065 [Roseiconus lacunae]|uniref:hypothetical protein n=1 Tax=Roseiconus lacunae TaxID=2605694 RepID=UPI00308C9E97|nr:hypothetical protein U8335_16065 [Stieleria sp. HD01]
MRGLTIILAAFAFTQFVKADDNKQSPPDAEKLLKDAIAYREKLPSSYAVTLRMLNVVLDDKGFIDSDTIYLFSEEPNTKYVAFGIANSRDGEFARRTWDQTLIRGLTRARRIGIPTGPFKDQTVENINIDPKESKTKRFLPEFDPFFFVLAQDTDFSFRRINRRFGSHIDQWYTFIEQKPAEKGCIESDWQVNKLVVKIWFDPSQGWLPVRIDRLGLPESGSNGERPTQSTQRIEWKKLEVGGDRIWLPVEFKRSAIKNRGKVTDLVGRFCWKETKERSVIPNLEEEDWRERFREEFDEQWNWNFEDYLRANSYEAQRKKR